MKRAACVLVLLLAAGCKDAPTKPAEVTPPSCDAQVADLRSFLTAVYDPAQPVTLPWPTGDAAFDKQLDGLRAVLREAAKPADPAQPQPKLQEGAEPGLIGDELAGCPPALAHLRTVGETSPQERTAAMIRLADAVGACDCKVNLAHVKPLLYLMQRSPD